MIRPDEAGGVPADPQALLDALLFAVAHDLRSPLLTLSLSADLLQEALSQQGARPAEGSPASVALSALRHGADDLERMLAALTALSRARRRPLELVAAPLQMLLGGHVVLSDEGDLGRRLVQVDVLAVRELLDAACGEQPAEVRVRMEPARAVLSYSAAPEIPAGAPLALLAGSLQRFAGSAVQALAVGQVLIERMGGAVQCESGRTTIWLPLAHPGAGAAAERPAG